MEPRTGSTPKEPVSFPGDRWLHLLVPAIPLIGFFSIAAMQSCMGLALLIWVIRLVRRGLEHESFPFLRCFLAFFLISVAAGFASGDWLGGLDEGLECLLPAVAYLVLHYARDLDRVERVLGALLLGAILAAAVGVAQTSHFGGGYRLRGTLSHYMTFSGLLQMGLLVGLARLIHAPGDLGRKLGLTLGVLLMAAALALTQTRGAWLGALSGVALLLLLWRPRLTLALPIIALAFYPLSPSPVQARYRSLLDPGDFTLQTRLHMWGAGRAMLQDHPLLGVGPGNTREHYEEYRLEGDPTPKPPSHLHSNPVQLAAERGILGLGAWLAVWASILLGAARTLSRTDPADGRARAAAAGTLAALVAFHVMGLFEFNHADSEVITVCLVIVGATMALGRNQARTATGEEPAPA